MALLAVFLRRSSLHGGVGSGGGVSPGGGLPPGSEGISGGGGVSDQPESWPLTLGGNRISHDQISPVALSACQTCQHVSELFADDLCSRQPHDLINCLVLLGEPNVGTAWKRTITCWWYRSRIHRTILCLSTYFPIIKRYISWKGVTSGIAKINHAWADISLLMICRSDHQAARRKGTGETGRPLALSGYGILIDYWTFTYCYYETSFLHNNSLPYQHHYSCFWIMEVLRISFSRVTREYEEEIPVCHNLVWQEEENKAQSFSHIPSFLKQVCTIQVKLPRFFPLCGISIKQGEPRVTTEGAQIKDDK